MGRNQKIHLDFKLTLTFRLEMSQTLAQCLIGRKCRTLTYLRSISAQAFSSNGV